MTTKQPRYTCVSKPGEYEIIGTSSGAGTMKGVPLIVYRDVKTGRLFHREPENFMARMKKIQSEQTDINAKLLAALELAVASTPKRYTDERNGHGDRVAKHPEWVETALSVIAEAKGGTE